jgi:hypothetical protein
MKRATRSRELLALGLWFMPVAGLYVSYAISQENWSCLRFILPAVPALILAGSIGITVLLPSAGTLARRRAPILVAVVLVVWTLASSWYWTGKLAILYTKGYERAYLDACAAARSQFPANALVLCGQTSGALYYYTNFAVLRWDTLQPADFARHVAQSGQSEVPIYALLYDVEESDALRVRCPGDWIKMASSGNIHLWRFNHTITARDLP